MRLPPVVVQHVLTAVLILLDVGACCMSFCLENQLYSPQKSDTPVRRVISEPGFKDKLITLDVKTVTAQKRFKCVDNCVIPHSRQTKTRRADGRQPKEFRCRLCRSLLSYTTAINPMGNSNCH